MVHTYKISGMTCSGCEATVKSNLLKLPDVESVDVSKDTGMATIGMAKHISVEELQNAIGTNSHYRVLEDSDQLAVVSGQEMTSYKPLFILFSFILVISFLASSNFMNFTNF